MEINVLKEGNGLRNRLIHEYNGISNDIAIAPITELIPSFSTLLEKIKTWIEKQRKK